MASISEKPTSAEKFSPEKSPLPDVIVLRLEIDDLCTFPPCSTDLAYNYTVMATPGSSSNALGAIGQRKMHEIRIDSYSTDEGSGSNLSSQSGIPEGTLSFFSGIPSVEVTKGFLHLYKPKQGTLETTAQAGSEIVCVLNIPVHLQLTDMLHFLSSILSTVTSLRVIRDSTPNQYMLLIKFKDKDSAKHFYSSFNGCAFNSIEPAICRLVFIIRVEIMKSSQGASLSSPDLIELPSCPVCLERLDDSVLTILCNHSFHMQCLTRWEDSTCPICRYTQTPEPCSEDNTCFSCESKEDLWICLICGNVGCGRYVGGHANMHFVETQHTFSMRLGRTQRVWDYIGDNYVHRLVQNKGDGKLVEVAGEGQALPSDQKIDSLQLEFSYLLSSQLESQCLFFKEKMARIEKDLTDQLQVVESRCRMAVGAKEELEVKIMELEKEKKANEKKINQQQTKLTKLTAELREEKEMNKCLSTNQKLWRDRVESLENKIDVTIHQKEQEMKDLQEQVRDLMFYLETQKKVEESPENTKQELQEGQILLPSTSASSSNTPSRKSRRKK